MRQTQRSCNFLQRLRTRGTDGSAAMEFAFVAPIFFTLMLGILQLGIMIFGQFALQNAVTQAARLIRTGQAQSINTAAAAQCVGGATPGNYGNAANSQQLWFNGQVCCGVTPLMDCSKLQVTVTPFAAGFNGGGNFGAMGAGGTYNSGNACDVVLVRATYPFPIWLPGLNGLMGGTWTFADTAGGSVHNLAGTSAFRNEPFNNGVAGC